VNSGEGWNAAVRGRAVAGGGLPTLSSQKSSSSKSSSKTLKNPGTAKSSSVHNSWSGTCLEKWENDIEKSSSGTFDHNSAIQADRANANVILDDPYNQSFTIPHID
jgi:hypothetical protein